LDRLPNPGNETPLTILKGEHELSTKIMFFASLRGIDRWLFALEKSVADCGDLWHGA